MYTIAVRFFNIFKYLNKGILVGYGVALNYLLQDTPLFLLFSTVRLDYNMNTRNERMI